MPGAPEPVRDATVHAYTVGFTAGAVIFAAGLVLALVLLPVPAHDASPGRRCWERHSCICRL